MTTINCPQCSGRVWVRDYLVAASESDGGLRLAWAPALGPLRWTCAGCGYQVKPDGLLSWRLDGSPLTQKEPVAGRSQ